MGRGVVDSPTRSIDHSGGWLCSRDNSCGVTVTHQHLVLVWNLMADTYLRHSFRQFVLPILRNIQLFDILVVICSLSELDFKLFELLLERRFLLLYGITAIWPPGVSVLSPCQSFYATTGSLVISATFVTPRTWLGTRDIPRNLRSHHSRSWQ
jgi:hypothetical protein